MIRGGSPAGPAFPAPRQPVTPPPREPVPVVPPQRTGPDRTVAEIIAAALVSPCLRCLHGPRRPCAGEGIMHLVRLCHAETAGLITAAEYSAVLLDEGVSFTAGIVFTGEMVTARLATRERYLAGFTARDREDEQYYGDYALREAAEARHAREPGRGSR